MLRVSGSRREECGLSYWNDDLSSLAVDAECQMPDKLQSIHLSFGFCSKYKG